MVKQLSWKTKISWSRNSWQTPVWLFTMWQGINVHQCCDIIARTGTWHRNAFSITNTFCRSIQWPHKSPGASDVPHVCISVIQKKMKYRSFDLMQQFIPLWGFILNPVCLGRFIVLSLSKLRLICNALENLLQFPRDLRCPYCRRISILV